MAKRYFKHDADSGLGAGIAYVEFDGEWALRQVEVYGERWFRSDTDYHLELGPALMDQPLSEVGLTSDNEITKDEFEDVWDLAKENSNYSGTL